MRPSLVLRYDAGAALRLGRRTGRAGDDLIDPDGEAVAADRRHGENRRKQQGENDEDGKFLPSPFAIDERPFPQDVPFPIADFASFDDCRSEGTRS
jgi:hypothetical protein